MEENLEALKHGKHISEQKSRQAKNDALLYKNINNALFSFTQKINLKM